MGAISGLITLISAIIILKNVQWTFDWLNWHNALGQIFIFLLEFLVLGGISVSIFRKFVSFDWKTRDLLKLTSVHKYFGYVMIFAT